MTSVRSLQLQSFLKPQNAQFVGPIPATSLNPPRALSRRVGRVDCPTHIRVAQRAENCLESPGVIFVDAALKLGLSSALFSAQV